MEYISPEAEVIDLYATDIISTSPEAPEGEWDTEM